MNSVHRKQDLFIHFLDVRQKLPGCEILKSIPLLNRRSTVSATHKLFTFNI